MNISNIKIPRFLILTIIFAGLLSGCASQEPLPTPSRQLTQDQVRQCSDGSSPVCITKMGKPTQCSCKAREEMRRILENPGDNAIFTPTEVPRQ